MAKNKRSVNKKQRNTLYSFMKFEPQLDLHLESCKVLPYAHMQQHDWIPERLFEPSVTLSQSALGSPGSDISMPPAIDTLSSPTHNPPAISKRQEVWKQNPSIHPFICLFINISVCSSIHPSIHSSVHSSIYLSVHPSIHPSIHSSVRSSIYLSVHPSIHFVPSIIHSSVVHQYICLFIRPSIHPSVRSSFVHQYICLFYSSIHSGLVCSSYLSVHPSSSIHPSSVRSIIYLSVASIHTIRSIHPSILLSVPFINISAVHPAIHHPSNIPFICFCSLSCCSSIHRIIHLYIYILCSSSNILPSNVHLSIHLYVHLSIHY